MHSSFSRWDRSSRHRQQHRTRSLSKRSSQQQTEIPGHVAAVQFPQASSVRNVANQDRQMRAGPVPAAL